MRASDTIRHARRRAGLSLRELADRAGTSHPTLAAYEGGRKVPRVDTLDRILRAAGFATDIELRSRADGPGDRASKGHELLEVLDLADRFPARPSRRLLYPAFGRRP